MNIKETNTTTNLLKKLLNPVENISFEKINGLYTLGEILFYPKKMKLQNVVN